MENGKNMDADLDSVDDDITDEVDGEDLLLIMDKNEEQIKQYTARHRIEELLEEKRLRKEIDDFDELDDF